MIHVVLISALGRQRSASSNDVPGAWSVPVLECEKIGCSDLNSWGVAVHVCNVCVVVIVVVGDGMDDLPPIMDVVMIMARHRHRTGHDKLAKLNLHH